MKVKEISVLWLWTLIAPLTVVQSQSTLFLEVTVKPIDQNIQSCKKYQVSWVGIITDFCEPNEWKNQWYAILNTNSCAKNSPTNGPAILSLMSYSLNN